MKKKKQKRFQGARKLRKDEEMAWVPPRKSRNGLIGKRREGAEKSAWRLEPEGETVAPGIITVPSAVESTYLDFDGKNHREQAEANISRRVREVAGEEGAEIQSPKRNYFG